MTRLDEHQAYAAMLLFLEHYYRNTKSDDVAALKSGMHLVAKGDHSILDTGKNG